jgi:hypothetical protein
MPGSVLNLGSKKAAGDTGRLEVLHAGWGTPGEVISR